MKSVLISIQPKWCELIASGKKTIEVRKTKPKLETPFKVYIYETKGKTEIPTFIDEEGHAIYQGRGQVIGEFVCDAILPISIKYSNPNSRVALKEFPFTCLTDKEIMDYLGNGKTGYGWHISNLVIYDKPRELSEFKKECNGICLNTKKRINCERFLKEGFSCDNLKPLKRPPQSWCYVESEVDTE